MEGDREVVLQFGLEHRVLARLVGRHPRLDVLEQVEHADEPVGPGRPAPEPVEQVAGEEAILRPRRDPGQLVGPRRGEHHPPAAGPRGVVIGVRQPRPEGAPWSTAEAGRSPRRGSSRGPPTPCGPGSRSGRPSARCPAVPSGPVRRRRGRRCPRGAGSRRRAGRRSPGRRVRKSRQRPWTRARCGRPGRPARGERPRRWRRRRGACGRWPAVPAAVRGQR